MEKIHDTLFAKLDEMQKLITSAMLRVFIGTILVLGGAAAGMIVFIATELSKKP